MTTFMFDGTLEELKELLLEHAIQGRWEDEPNDRYMMRHRSGANLHWASTSGRVWIDGEHAAAARLRQRLIEID